MKKSIYLIIILLFSLSNIYSSVYDSNQALKELNTEHFNIVFDENSINEALLIYDNCEDLYSSISNFYDLKRTQVIDVAITSDIQNYNAYFSLNPNPRIVLYNTIAVNNNFNVFSSDLILNTFKHELTHALTRMGENNIFREVFSQGLSFATFNMTKFNSEGLAVISESQNGEGRLNNAYYKSRILEILLEDKFLKYNEVQGNRDIYPSDVFYLFGSFFNQYLIDTYGLDKFQKYVKELNTPNLLFLDANYSFNKVYSKNLYHVWQEFKLSFTIPKTKDINCFEYDYLPSFIFRDDNSVLVAQLRNDSIKDVETGKTLIKNLDNTYWATSNENKIILSSYIRDRLNKTNTIVIDSDNNKTELNLKNFKMPIAYNDYIIGIYNEGQKQYIAFAKNGVIEKKISVNDNEFIQKIDILNDKIVYLSHSNEKYKINIILEDNKFKSYDIDNVEIIDFSISNDNKKIILNTVKNNQLPRLAYIDLKNDQLYINNFDMVGGVFNPIVIDDEVYYISKFFETNKLRKTNLNEFDFIKNPININENLIKNNNIPNYDLSTFKNYNKFKYIFDGSLIPFVLPNADFKTFNGNLYFESIDPAESLNTRILFNSDLYGDFNSHLILQFYNEIGNVSNTFSLRADAKLKTMFDTVPNARVDYIYRRIFDLLNNNLVFLSTEQGLFLNDINYLSSYQLGFRHSRSIGPTLDNLFMYQFYYQFDSIIDYFNNDFAYRNVLSADLRFPYLLPNLKANNITLNLPFKLSYKFLIDNQAKIAHELNLSVLLYKQNIQSAFTKLPFYLNNIQVYLEYKYPGLVNLYTLFGGSITQTNLNLTKFYPGFKYSYGVLSNTFKYEIGLYTSF